MTAACRQLCVLVCFALTLRFSLFKLFGIGEKQTEAFAIDSPTFSYLTVREASALVSYRSIIQTSNVNATQSKSDQTTHGVNGAQPVLTAYSGGLCHIPPLILFGLLFLNCGESAFTQYALITLLDIVTALCLADVAKTASTWKVFRYESSDRSLCGTNSFDDKNRHVGANAKKSSKQEKQLSKHEQRKSDTNQKALKKVPNNSSEVNKLCGEDMSNGAQSGTMINSPILIAAVYLLNPLLILQSMSLSLHSIRSFFIALSLAAACHRSRPMHLIAAAALGCLLYTSPPLPLLLLLPIGHVIYFSREKCNDERFTKDKASRIPTLPATEILSSITSSLKFSFVVVMIFSLLHLASYYMMNFSWDYMDTTVFSVLNLCDITPGLSPFWYMMTLVFERFLLLYRLLLQGFPFVFIFPIFILFFNSGLPVCQLSIAIYLLLQPYPAAADFALILALLLIHEEATLKQTDFVFWVSITVIGICMFPVVKHLWLVRNTGNANFVHVFQLMHFLGNCHLIASWMKSLLHVQDELQA